MNTGFAIYTIDQIEPLLDRRGVIEAVREALVQHARGAVQSPMPGQLVFGDARGDCHIKYGHLSGSPSFAVKIATGFRDNGRLGLPTGNGLVLLFDACTGAPLCLFQDQGWMTAWRTAAATALAVQCLAPDGKHRIGIIGTGPQARLTPEWIRELLPDASFLMTGRDLVRTRETAALCGAEPVSTVAELLAAAEVVVTATTSAEPLFSAAAVRPGTHVVALGADGPEKQELPVELFARAAHVVCDDIRQCASLSDFGKAVDAGAIERRRALTLGHVLGGDVTTSRLASDITIVDLTGLAAQDIAVATWFGTRLAETRC